LPEEVIYQRFVRDRSNKFLKCYNNTIINCTFNDKDKEIFFISKNSIFRSRLHKWNEYISEVIKEERNYAKALKICIEIYHQRLNIFVEPVPINEKTMRVFCEIGKIYLQQRLKEIIKINEDRLKNISDTHSIQAVEP